MFLNSSVKLFKHSIIFTNVPLVRSFIVETQAKDLFMNILGMKEETAQNYIVQHDVSKLDEHRLQSTLKFLKERKYHVIDIITNPVLINHCNHKTWKNYYDYFRECGCTEVPITCLIKFRRIRYTSIADLKEIGLMPKDNSVVKSLLKHLDICLEKETQDLCDDKLSLSYVHRAVTHRYLVKRLNATMEQLESINRVHKQVYNKSLKMLCENVNLALEIGFTPHRIMRNPYILQVNPSTTRDAIENVPKFFNCNILALMRFYPKLVGLPVSHIQNIYSILKRNDIPDSSILRNANIFTLAAQTVQDRLKDIASTPETRVLMCNPKILQIIVHYHRARSRRQFLQQVRLKCCSLLVIGFREAVFDNYIKEGKDINSRQETLNFIRTLLRCNQQAFDLNLKRHPYYLYVPFVEIEQTHRYLRHLRFTNVHLAKAISILLYPKEAIATALRRIKDEHYLSTRKPRANKTQILNLALYYLERDHYFSGNGIWRGDSEE